MALTILPPRPVAQPIHETQRAIWRRCGGPSDEIPQLLMLLEELQLLRTRDELLVRTKAGDEVARAATRRDLTPLGLALIRAGRFHDQARVLIEAGQVNADGDLQCSRRMAETAAAQLLGVLGWWVGVQTTPNVVIPSSLLVELNTVWALLPPPVETPSWVTDRKRVGDRAEMYTLQTERSEVRDPSQIVWVSRDSDSLGWDIEDRSQTVRRYIEVKGSRDETVTFNLSPNELAKAQELGYQYELQFWGGINLARDPAVEYAALRAFGYPLRFPNLAAELGGGSWDMKATNWRVVRV